MPRTRGAATERSDTRRHRGDHDNQTKKSTAGERRAAAHATAEATTDSLQLFINQAMKYPLLTAAEEVELAQAIERGDLAAKERLINSNLRLVIKFARRYQGHGLDLGDLVQEAMLGLIRAAEKFDWRRGYKFSTYAVLWIKQSIQRGLDNTGRQVRIPAHIAQRERTVNRITGELTREARPRAHRRGGREGVQAAARRGHGRSRPDPCHAPASTRRSATATPRSASSTRRAPATSRTRCSSASRSRPCRGALEAAREGAPRSSARASAPAAARALPARRCP